MLHEVESFTREKNLFTKSDRILVGFSGGPDSTCLLHLLAKAGFQCVAAHLNHGQRAEAEEEVESCARFAESLDVPFLSGRVDVPLLAKHMKVGLEEAGREARYNFFRRAAAQMECSVIATAHTQSDQAETILMNLTRGSGLRGLKGMPSKRGNIVRPLLKVTRKETVAYCRDHELPTLSDPANQDLNFARARIRHRVIPELRILNSNVEPTISAMTELLEEEDNFLDGMAAAALEQSERIANPDLAFLTKHLEFRIERKVLITLPDVLLRRAIRLGFGSLGGQLELYHTHMICGQLRESERGSFTSLEGLAVISWNEEVVTFARREEIAPFRIQLDIGILESDEMGWKLTARVARWSGTPSRRRTMTAEIPVQAVKKPLYIRSVQSGDRMRPLGFQSTRKVSDLLSEAKVTRLARQRIPLVCDMVGPLWLPGVCMDARAATGGTSIDVICLSFGAL